MPNALRLELKELGHPGVTREVELLDSQTLQTLADLMARELNLGSDGSSTFYLGGDASAEDLMLRAGGGGPPAVKAVRLDSLDLQPGDQLAHLHDFVVGRRHLLTLVAVEAPAPGLTYPRVVARRGAAPDEWGNPPWDATGEEAFQILPDGGQGDPEADPPEAHLRRVDGAMSAFFEGRPPRSRALLRACAEVAEEVMGRATTLDRVARLETMASAGVSSWLAALAAELEEEPLRPLAGRIRCWLQALPGQTTYAGLPLQPLADALRAFPSPPPRPRPLGDPPALAALAGQVLDACRSRHRLLGLGDLLSRSVGDWLEAVALELALGGQAAQAIGIATRLAALQGGPELLLELGLHLVAAPRRRRDQAQAALRALLRSAELVPEWRLGEAEVGWSRLQAAGGDPDGARARLRAQLARRHLGVATGAKARAALAGLEGGRRAGGPGVAAPTWSPRWTRLA